MPSGQGFGKAAQALPVKPKRKKAKGKLASYTMAHFGPDGVLRVLRLEAHSRGEALEKFGIFVGALELCIDDATDEQILRFIEDNPL